MSIAFKIPSLVVSPGQTLSLSQIVDIPPSSGNPAYLVLGAGDRNEYTVHSSGATGSFSGASHTLGFSLLTDDVRTTGIVFNYVPASGRYLNATYGYFDQLTYTASTSNTDTTVMSLFGTSSLANANAYATSPVAFVRAEPAAFLGTLTIAAEAGYTATVPTQATPLSIAAVAQSFVGSAWNAHGCWTLINTITAEAGASLPVTAAVNTPGVANGEWIVAYNGPAGSTGDWASSVRTGDIINFVTPTGSGHITTCVSGAGSTARLLDNTTYTNASGAITNSANDGSSDDIIIKAAHAASQEFSGVAASSVVIYRLDAPVVTPLTATLQIAAGGTANLANVFSATDPAGKTLTSFQVYTSNAADRLTVNGVAQAGTSASSAITASSLSQFTFTAGPGAVADAVTVRAYNGTYWGDWTTVTASVTPATISTGNLTSDSGEVSIDRFFDKTDGTHFFTASAAETATIMATRSDLAYEGVGLHGYATAAASPSSEAVFRFFDTADGTHFYTASTSERDALAATRSDMTFEGTAFYEDATPQAGDTAVYRFFDTAHGTHLFTQSATEKASILATRPDLVSEGIAFYAPT